MTSSGARHLSTPSYSFAVLRLEGRPLAARGVDQPAIRSAAHCLGKELQDFFVSAREGELVHLVELKPRTAIGNALVLTVNLGAIGIQPNPIPSDRMSHRAKQLNALQL